MGLPHISSSARRSVTISCSCSLRLRAESIWCVAVCAPTSIPRQSSSSGYLVTCELPVRGPSEGRRTALLSELGERRLAIRARKAAS